MLAFGCIPFILLSELPNHYSKKLYIRIHNYIMDWKAILIAIPKKELVKKEY